MASSDNTRIFYSIEAHNRSGAGIWPGATRGDDAQEDTGADSRQGADLLNNRASRALAMGLLKERSADQVAKLREAHPIGVWGGGKIPLIRKLTVGGLEEKADVAH